MAFNHKHLIDITEYSADDIMTVLETAVRFKEVNERRIKQVPTLKASPWSTCSTSRPLARAPRSRSPRSA